MGSVLVGSQETIDKARLFRKVLGGGWRQAGILAGAALHALKVGRKQLQKDHENATKLADGLAKLGFVILHKPETNMVWTKYQGMNLIGEKLNEMGIKIDYSEDIVRWVTHIDVSNADVDTTIAAVAKLIGAQSASTP